MLPGTSLERILAPAVACLATKRLSSRCVQRHSSVMVILVDKILTQLAMPLGLGLLVLAYAVMAMAIGRRRQALTAAVVAGLLIWISPHPSWRMCCRGHWRSVSRPPVDSYPVVDVAVLLGGALSPPDSEAGLFRAPGSQRQVVQLPACTARVRRRILIAGGNVFGGDGLTEASAIADFLVFMVSRAATSSWKAPAATRARMPSIRPRSGVPKLWTRACWSPPPLHMPRALAAFERSAWI